MLVFPAELGHCDFMDIDLSGFAAHQQSALFDLLILAMHADGHLTSFEDEHLQQLLIAMGFKDETDRRGQFAAEKYRRSARI